MRLLSDKCQQDSSLAVATYLNKQRILLTENLSINNRKEKSTSGNPSSIPTRQKMLPNGPWYSTMRPGFGRKTLYSKQCRCWATSCSPKPKGRSKQHESEATNNSSSYIPVKLLTCYTARGMHVRVPGQGLTLLFHPKFLDCSLYQQES